MDDLEKMKRTWKVLDENLQKTDIIQQNQIKKITMNKIDTRFEKWGKKNQTSMIAGGAVALFFSIKWLLEGHIWESLAFLSVITVLIVLSLIEKKEIKSFDIHRLTTAEFLSKVENLQFRKQREKLLGIPILIFMLFICYSTIDGNIAENAGAIVGFIGACAVAFIFGYKKMQKNFSNLKKDLQELDDLKKEEG